MHKVSLCGRCQRKNSAHTTARSQMGAGGLANMTKITSVDEIEPSMSDVKLIRSSAVTVQC